MAGQGGPVSGSSIQVRQDCRKRPADAPTAFPENGLDAYSEARTFCGNSQSMTLLRSRAAGGLLRCIAFSPYNIHELGADPASHDPNYNAR